MHAALDLAFDKHRIDRLSDVVHRDNLLDRAGLWIGDHQLCRVTEARVDGRVLDSGLAELLRPVDDVLPLVVNTNLAATGDRRHSRLAH